MVTDIVDVVVPWRPGDPNREAAWSWLRPHWLSLGPVVEGTPPDGPWCKAAAVADALAHCDSEIVVVADADVWCDGVAEAIEAVRDGATWAIPHRNVFRLDEASTARVLATGQLGALEGHRFTEYPYRGHPGGGIVVIRRDVYDDCPLDRRFTGWGQEDNSWAAALTCLHGAPWKGRRPLWHLWHPPEPRHSRRIGSASCRALWARYERARRNPVGMRALVDEARLLEVA